MKTVLLFPHLVFYLLWKKMVSTIGVRLGCDLATVKAVAYIFILIKSFSKTLRCGERGGVIPEETTPVRRETFHLSVKVSRKVGRTSY